MLVSSRQSGVPDSIASYTSPSQLYQSVDINRSHYDYCTRSKYQEVQEERHTLWLCAGVFESPYTANFTRFFPFDMIPTHFIYTSKLLLLQSCHILRINELITKSSNFYTATFFSAFVSFIFLFLSLFAFVIMHICIMK